MKPRRFRIRDFRSIVDSGECVLSKDGITVLAGQNESGKTAILCALRDFDLEPGASPETTDYTPDARDEVQPTVSVQFETDVENLVQWLNEENVKVPVTFFNYLRTEPLLWIHRDLPSGKYTFDKEVNDALATPVEPDPLPNLAEEKEEEEDGGDESESRTFTLGFEIVDPEKLVNKLREYWPSFIYFDSFENRLPKEVDVDLLLAPAASKDPQSTTSTTRSSAPPAVRDFITLSGIEPLKVQNSGNEDKALSNYLQKCGTTITGNFLSYWKSGVSGEQHVKLIVSGGRSEDGSLKLRFYVSDGSINQYPEQRSKGFLWFLSFYLTLTAARIRRPDRDSLILIDEPGSYLHERAQRDILSLLEKEIVPNQIIYSTHSRPLLPATRLHRLRLVAKRAERGTIIYDRLTHPDLRGEGFKDTLSPILDAIGLDLREGLSLAREQNLLVEGMSDRLYLNAWSARYDPAVADSINVFPGTSASTVPLLASLFVGWGLGFGVLLDRDQQGLDAKRRLIDELGLPEERIVQPHDGLTIEDVFASKDFQMLLAMIERTYEMKANENPSKAIKRMSVDKVLLARTYAESAAGMTLSEDTEKRIRSLLGAIKSAVPKPATD